MAERILWLASYPKSGNTWTRVLLTNYLRDADTPADINALDGGPIASARLWFDEWSGVQASLLSDAVIERLRPQVYRCMAREATDRLYMKVHDAWSLTDRGEGLFPADVTAGVLYILRNPLDIAPSLAHHYGIGIERAVQHLCDPAYALSRGVANQVRQRLRCWSGHVRSWVMDSGLPVHVLRYEDLRRDPVDSFGEALRFGGLPEDADRLRKAVAFSDLAELQRQEQAAGFRESAVSATDAFFRRGEVGGWRRALPPDLAQRIIDTHGDTMRRFGYLNDVGDPL